MNEGSYPELFLGRPLAQGRSQVSVELLAFVSSLQDSIENERKARTADERLKEGVLDQACSFSGWWLVGGILARAVEGKLSRRRGKRGRRWWAREEKIVAFNSEESMAFIAESPIPPSFRPWHQGLDLSPLRLSSLSLPP